MATVSKTFSVRNGLDVANTVVLDSNRNISNVVGLNVATANATTVNATNILTSAGLDITGQANNARDQANTARDQANAAYLQANNAYAEANLKLNIAGGTITGSLNVANITESNVFVSTSLNVVPPNLANTDGERIRLYDFDQAGRPNYAIGVEGGHIWMGIDGSANNLGWKWYGNTSLAARLSGNGSFEVANSVVANQFLTVSGLDITGQANDAYAQANSARGQANSARDQANTARDTANGAYSQANGAYAQANGAYAQANGAYDQANGAYSQANGAYSQANGAYTQANVSANTVRVYANSAGELSNKFLNFVNTTSIQVTVFDNSDGNANISFTTTGAAVADAYAQANAAYDQANSARGQANTGYGQANDAYEQANTARDQANTARTTANDAYAEANSKLDLTGGIIVGDITITGNLFVNGTETIVNTESLTINDPIFLLANNNTTNAVGLGFTAHYGPTQQHTGLIRAHQDNLWYLFEDYDDHILYANNVLDTGNIKLATLRANINANSLLLLGETVATQANLTLAHDQANTARDQANTARGTANDSYAQANSARDQANTARDQANTGYGQANAAYAQANSARDQANTGYGQANAAYAQANSARDQANTGYSQANLAYAQANAAYADSNTRVLKAGDTMTGGLTITTTGEGFKVANANVTNYLSIGILNVTTNTVTTSTTGQVVLDTFALTDHASAKYFVQANSGTDYTVTEVVVMHDGTNIYLTEYGTIQSGPSLGIFSADIDSGSARLLFTANNNVNTIRSVRYGVLVP